MIFHTFRVWRFICLRVRSSEKTVNCLSCIFLMQLKNLVSTQIIISMKVLAVWQLFHGLFNYFFNRDNSLATFKGDYSRHL